MKIIATTRKVKVEDKEDFTSGGFQDLTIEVELSKEYENLYNYVTFGNVAVPVIEGKVKTPTLTAGICKIGVYGYDGKDKLKLRYSPLPIDVLVKKGSFTDRTAQQSIPTPTEFEKCVDELRDLLKEAKIVDGSVTTEKLADQAVTREKLAPGSVDDIVLHPEIIEFLDSRAGRDEIPIRIKQLVNDTHFREYVEILDEATANKYVSESGAKHKLLQDADFYLAYFPEEINTQHTYKYSKAGKTSKSDNPAEYIIMYISGVAVGSSEVLLDDNGEADLTFYTDNDKYNYGGTDSYRILLGKPYISDGFDIESDWDNEKGTEMKGDSLLGDKSSVAKNYSVHIKQLDDAKQCTISCSVTFQKYERSGLSMKWVTKDAGTMNIPFTVTRPRSDTKFKGLYFIAQTQTLNLSASSDLADKLNAIEKTLSTCVKRNEPLKLIGEITFDGSQTEKGYEFPFPQDFQKIIVSCSDLTSAASSHGNMYFAIRGVPTIEIAGNQFVGRFGTKMNGLIQMERFGDFVLSQSANLWLDILTFGKLTALGSPYDLYIQFDETIPASGKVSIYYV